MVASVPNSDQAILNRLILRSLADDGEFARILLARVGREWIPKVRKCIVAAIAAGDAIEGIVQPRLSGWLTHHVAAMIMLHLLPTASVVDYGMSEDQLVEQTVWFTLRGMGLKEKAIARYYNPKALALFNDASESEYPLMNDSQAECRRQRSVIMRRAWHFVNCLAALSCVAGCSQAPAEGPAPPPATVKVSQPLERAVTDYADFTGRTMAVESVKLRARVWGHLEKINFTEGADVKKDEVLFVIDQRPYKAALARADAEVAQSEARYKRLARRGKTCGGPGTLESDQPGRP